MQIFNTLSRKKELLKPFGKAQNKKLKLFVCGITPYDFAHLGHARTYIAFDAFVKYLRSAGFRVLYLQNITDVDDKIIQRAKELNKTPKSLARRFEKEYLKNMKELRVDSVNKYARATEHIKEIVNQVKKLLAKGFAYEIENDGIYFDISKFKGYGKLSGRTNLQAQDAVSRIDESVQKRNKGDFALWKFSKPGEPKWPSPWGKGRPGWHIEDTAISEKYFGAQYDMHGGGIDLMFPHHEAEIAQMEAISGKEPFVKYWLHTGFLTIEGEKMSKSLGNFITINNFLSKHSPRVLRFFVLKTHYRSPIDYSEELLLQTQHELRRIDEFAEKLKSSALPSRQISADKEIQNFQDGFSKALGDDFNTPKATAVVFELIRWGNALLAQNQLSKKSAKTILRFLKEIDKILDLDFANAIEKVPEEILQLAKQREECRKNKQWQKADKIRSRINLLGWQVDDTSEGFVLRTKP
ncbi:MAG: cysteine--tRNA ligase [Candidatus Wildermuthbacteria bacterium]|nr:cysteine--tRNA ligase [Candidatus Wildermuthbacteria bacterium]